MPVLNKYKGIPYEVAKKKLDALLDALDVVLTGQSYTIGSRTLTRANLTAIQEAIKYWSDIVSKCESGCGGVKVQRAIPQDF